MKHLKTFESLNDYEIFEAIYDNDLYKVKKLIKDGINIEHLNFNEWTPLYYAITIRKYNIANFLIDAGANVNYKKIGCRFSPLMIAINNNNLTIVKKLIKYGANINDTDADQNSPLILSSYYNKYLSITIELIKAGADWNVKNDSNYDFLDFLSDKNKETIINKYPEKYQEYLAKKEAEKYNI